MYVEQLADIHSLMFIRQQLFYNLSCKFTFPGQLDLGFFSCLVSMHKLLVEIYLLMEHRLDNFSIDIYEDTSSI